MGRDTMATVDFARAAAHEPELNGRQRQVLDLLVGGKTNGEIAEALGMTFDGAKWNVSEILSKLGLESREEAAAYWRWRKAPHRRAVRRVRSLLGTAVVRAAAGVGGAGVVGLAVLAFWFALGGGAGRDTGGATDFKLEGAYYERLEGANFQLQPPGLGPEGRISIIATGPSHFSFLVTDDSPRLEAVDRFSRLDDEGLWVSAPDATSRWDYVFIPVRELPATYDRNRALSVGAMIGPAGVSSIDELIARMEASHPRIERHEQILGIDAVVIAYGPTWVNGEAQTTGGTGRIWVDPVTMVILRRTEEGNDGSLTRWAEAMEFKPGRAEPLPTWNPPRGSVIERNQPATPAPSVIVPDRWPGMAFDPEAPALPKLPAPFLPMVIPEGFRVGAASSGGVQVALSMSDGDGRSLSIAQLVREGLPAGLQRGEAVELPGGTAGYLRDIGSGRGLAFAMDGVSVLLTASGLSDEELVRVAELMTG